MKLKENREIWINRVEDYKLSGLTQKAWCEKNGLKTSTFSYWIRNFNEASSTTSDNLVSSGFEFASVSISQDFSSTVGRSERNVYGMVGFFLHQMNDFILPINIVQFKIANIYRS
ncbi:hypothetical protein CACET_c21500 [Clostridium aceticum]|uniref:Transposase n=1 Tax=Clostridium aceticum TaxID=84022 RepID=A0A0G3WCF4_9CLOT|nr:hypothetical protein [Clostridium aceticum]AKL95597.1 hypothetical protein CACET_c21500 [Clostridium aceticum]